MSPDSLFQIATWGVMPAWLLLMFAPKWSGTLRLVQSAFVPMLLATAYLTCLIAAPPLPSASTLPLMIQAFSSPWLAVAVWLHFLAFDLFVAAWMVRDAQKLELSRWLVTLCLVPTLFYGPIGLALYLAVRFALRRRATLYDT